MKQNKKVLKYFLKLVTISSPSGQEQKIATYLLKWLKNHQFSTKTDDSGSIIGIHKGTKPSIMFCAHMDTVNPCQNIKPVIQNNNITSDGTSILGADNKASLASILTAVENYYKNNGQNSIELLFTVKEETGGGVENFPKKWIKSKTCYIFDCAKPLGKIIIKSPHIINFQLQLKGKSAHSSKPKNGRNSLLSAIKLVEKINMLNDSKTLINIGVLNSGIAVNSIPEFSIIKGEIRSFDKNNFYKKIYQIKSISKNISLKNKIKSKLIFDAYGPGYSYNPNNKIIQNMVKIYKNIGTKASFIYDYGISDTNYLIKKGIATINMTDGVQNSHTTKESVSINNLEKLTKIISEILR